MQNFLIFFRKAFYNNLCKNDVIFLGWLSPEPIKEQLETFYVTKKAFAHIYEKTKRLK